MTERWIGKPIKCKPHDFFKTKKSEYPSYMFRDSDGDGVADVFDCKPYDPKRQGLIGDVMKSIGRGMSSAASAVGRGMRQAYQKTKPVVRRAYLQTMTNVARMHPKYSINQELRGSGLSKEQKKEIKERFKQSKTSRKQLTKSVKRLIYSTYPQAAPYTEKGKLSGIPGRRGRPTGTLDPRYAAYGGVFGWRRYMANQRRAYKEKLRQQEEMVRQQRGMQPVAPQGVPQEVQEAIPEYSEYNRLQGEEQMPTQIQQVAPQQVVPQMAYRQMSPQMQPPQQKRPIITPFKSSGGSPYPPVDGRRLAPARETFSQGYIEVVDPFSGRRYLKKADHII